MCFLVLRKRLSSRKLSFCCFCSTLSLCFDCSQIFPLRKESVVLSAIVTCQAIRDLHYFFLPVAGLDYKDKVGAEVAVIQKMAVPEHDVVNSVILLDCCLWAVQTVDQDICTWWVLHGFLSCTIFEWVVKPTVWFNLLFVSGSDEMGIALTVTVKSTGVVTNLVHTSMLDMSAIT